MKKLFPILCLCVSIMLLLPELSAQPRHQLGARYVWTNYVTPKRSGASFGDVYTGVDGYAIELFYGARMAPGTLLQIPVKFGEARFVERTDEPGEVRRFGTLDVLMQQELVRYGSIITPTIHLGIGGRLDTESEDLDFNVPVGLGFNIRLARDFYFNAQTQFRYSPTTQNGWHHGVGLHVNFGKAVGDRDRDGVSDADDACPDQAGTAATLGCPDRDADGVADRDDKCPTLAGTAAQNGCPDRDNDGLADNDDRCPEQPGTEAKAGCPDTDADGLVDLDDACPTLAGPANLRGCPDRDADGLIDPEDACPDLAGPANLRGCPDRDADGVSDADDACPDKPGLAAQRGCPDTDGDGVYDHEDRCVSRPGPASNKGCPEIRKEDREVITLAVRNVQFESGRSTLLVSSFKALDDLARVLQRYPDYSVAINGHTDNAGDDKFNLDLSQRRANTCRDYLLSRGIPQGRMVTQGYGEERPIASNDTQEGKAMNRRVEFELFLK